jgi:hypothetical protein
MGTQSRRHPPWKRLLHLEPFERRDVPAVINPLLSLLHSAPLSFVAVAIHTNHEAHFAFPEVGQTDAHVSSATKADLDSPPNVAVTSNVDTSSSPVDAATTTDVSAGDPNGGTGVSGSADSNTSSSDNVSIGADVSSSSQQDASSTSNPSADLSGADSGNAAVDTSTTVSQTAVSVDATETAQLHSSTNSTNDPNQGSGGQTTGSDQGNTGATGTDQGSTGSTGTDQGSTGSVDGSVDNASSASSSNTTTNVTTSENATAQAAVGADQASNDKQAVTGSTDGLYVDGVDTGGQKTHEAARDTSLPADHGSLARSEQASGLVSSTAYSSADMSARAGVGDPANRVSTVNRNTAGDRSNAVRELNFTNQDASRGRADDGLNTSAPSAGVATLVGKVQAPESSTGSDHVGSASSRLISPDGASPAPDSRFTLTPFARRASSGESSPTDLLIDAQAPVVAKNLQARVQDGPDETVDHSVSGLERSAGQVNPSLLFDLEKLAQEADRLFAGVEQMGQDLATILDGVHPLSRAIAVGVAATAITAAHRRFKQKSRGVARERWADGAFACYPGLGGPWLGLES